MNLCVGDASAEQFVERYAEPLGDPNVASDIYLRAELVHITTVTLFLRHVTLCAGRVTLFASGVTLFGPRRDARRDAPPPTVGPRCSNG